MSFIKIPRPMKNKILCKLLLVLLVMANTLAYSQSANVAINATGTAPNADAILDLSNNTNGGFLLPGMATTSGITGTIPNSLLIYNTAVNCIEAYYTPCTCWQAVYCPCSAAAAT